MAYTMYQKERVEILVMHNDKEGFENLSFTGYIEDKMDRS